MKKYLWLFITLSLGHSALAQQIKIEKGKDSLVIPTNDSLFTIPFSVKGTTIGQPLKITITTIPHGSAEKNIDFTLQDNKVNLDTLIINTTDNKGRFNVFVRSGQEATKSILLAISIWDKVKLTHTHSFLTLHPPKNLLAKNTAPDTATLKIYKDLDIPVYYGIGYKHKVKVPRRLWWTLWVFRDRVHDRINLDSVKIDYEAPDKFRPALYSTEDGVYFNNKAITLKRIWMKEDKLYLNGDRNEKFIYLRDFVQYVPLPKQSVLRANNNSDTE